MAVVLSLLTTLLIIATSVLALDFDCPKRDEAFELSTGFVFTSPDSIVDTKPGVLKLEECIEACRLNATCWSVNYETGLCVLFSSSAESTPGALSPSQFPVFTLYAQKICVRASRSRCNRSWIFDRVSAHMLEGFVKKQRKYQTREDCMAACLAASTFTCRSVNYNKKTGLCTLSEMDRNSVGNPQEDFKLSIDHEYMENNCANDPVSQCQFRPIRGLILKTVDSVFQNVADLDECRQLCVYADYRCHSFDYGDTGSKVCRLSHHSSATLLQIEEPYLEAAGATNYELGACYNVTVECKSSYMVAKVRTNRVFNGRMYGKTRPNSCTIDVRKSLDFELFLGFNDIDCDVRQEVPGKFASDVVIQHHDMIVTSNDVGLEVKCNYNLFNKTIMHSTDLNVQGELPGGNANAEQTIVQAPNVTMRITDRSGKDINSAKVGDGLALRFEIQDKHNSPYEIFVRELIASDGIDASEILLIDALGCPTDFSIMGVLEEVNGSGQLLQANFEAFKFPTSSVVQFRALVTPCIPRCDPVVCDITDSHGASRSLNSFGKKKRKKRSMRDDTAKDDDAVMVAGVIHITDQFKLNQDSASTEWQTNCQNSNINEQLHLDDQGEGVFSTAAIGGTLFLLAQCVLLAFWTVLYFKNRRLRRILRGEEMPPDPQSAASGGQQQPYKDFDPYLSTIFRPGKKRSNNVIDLTTTSSPDSSLDLHSSNKRKLILTHLDRGQNNSRKP